VDLKYVLSTQVVQVQYEGIKRCFAVSSVSRTARNAKDIASDVSESLSALDINDLSSIYIVDWDTTVAIDDGIQASESKPSEVGNDLRVVQFFVPSDLGAQFDVGVSEQAQGTDAYTSVGGLDEQISQVRDLIEIPLRCPELFRHFGECIDPDWRLPLPDRTHIIAGLKPPRGLLLHGPPGTGKTHLARAISASTGSSVLTVNGPELTSAYHGETEASLRRVFAAARSRAPCIIILDEVDAICPRRVDDAGGEVEKRVVATLLTEMDGIESADGERVVVIATTNRPNAIDPALRRPGRFDREIEIGQSLPLPYDNRAQRF
jgi:AAA family ATPase